MSCAIFGNILWHPETFLIKHIPTLGKNLDIKALANNRLTQIVSKSQNLSKESYILYSQVIHLL